MTATTQSVNSSSMLTLAVLEEVGRRQPVSLVELAALFDRPKTTVHRALLTLSNAGWIRRNGPERTRWILTPRAVGVARQAGNVQGLRDLARPVLARLRADTGESTLLAVVDDRSWCVVEFLEGLRPIRLSLVDGIGVRYPLHAGANGKVILATWSPDDIEQYIEGGLDSQTPSTPTSAERLLADLDAVRVSGHAFTHGEALEDTSGVAAAIVDDAGLAVGSLSVGLPTYRLAELEAREEIARLVTRAADEVSSAIQAFT